MVVADMPFMTYHISIEEAKKNAGKLMQEGKADAVKLEGGAQVAGIVAAIVRAGHSGYGAYRPYQSGSQVDRFP